mgnify:FL=1
MGGNLPDSCPLIFGTSTIQRYGCVDSDNDGLDDVLDAFPEDPSETMDSDNDGVGDNSDAYPQDAKRTVLETESDSDNMFNFAVIGVVILVLLAVLVLVATRRKDSSDLIPANNPIIDNMYTSQLMQNQVVLQTQGQVSARQGPPLPPEGLPAGWTMEQWAWYGEDYLRNK